MGALTVTPDRLVLTVGTAQDLTLTSAAGRYLVTYPAGVSGPSEVVLSAEGVAKVRMEARMPVLSPKSILILREGSEVQVGVRIPVVAVAPGARVTGGLELLGLGRVAHAGEQVELRVRVGSEAPVYMTGSVTIQSGAQTHLRAALPGEFLLPEQETAYKVMLQKDQVGFLPSRALLEVVTPLGTIERPVWYAGSTGFWILAGAGILVLVTIIRARITSKRSPRRSSRLLNRLRWRRFR